MSLRLFLATALIALPGQVWADNPSPTASPAPASLSPEVKAGDQWIYAYHSELDKRITGTKSYIVQDVSSDKIETEVRTHGSSGSRDIVVNLVFNPTWRMIEAPKGKIVKIDGVSQPFASVSVGKDWTTDLLWQPLNSSLNFKWTEHGHVNAWESVTLASGQVYDAFRITKRTESTPVEGTGIQVVTAGLSTQKVVERNVEWYAPTVNRYVKRTFESSRNGVVVESFSEELTSYKRGD